MERCPVRRENASRLVGLEERRRPAALAPPLARPRARSRRRSAARARVGARGSGARSVASSRGLSGRPAATAAAASPATPQRLRPIVVLRLGRRRARRAATSSTGADADMGLVGNLQAAPRGADVEPPGRLCDLLGWLRVSRLRASRPSRPARALRDHGRPFGKRLGEPVGKDRRTVAAVGRGCPRAVVRLIRLPGARGVFRGFVGGRRLLEGRLVRLRLVRHTPIRLGSIRLRGFGLRRLVLGRLRLRRLAREQGSGSYDAGAAGSGVTAGSGRLIRLDRLAPAHGAPARMARARRRRERQAARVAARLAQVRLEWRRLVRGGRRPAPMAAASSSQDSDHRS